MLNTILFELALVEHEKSHDSNDDSHTNCMCDKGLSSLKALQPNYGMQ